MAALGVAPCAEPPWLGAPASLPPAVARLEPLDRALSFEDEVAPVLARRCVVCHACYDAPCQLRLSSPEGIERGASKAVVYDASRLAAIDPTRLGVDATTPAEWRAKGFFPVHGRGAGERGSLLLGMLALGAMRPPAPGERLPPDVDLDIYRPLRCPAPGELGAYAAEHPHGGMPYGTAPLDVAELQLLASWALQGAPLPDARAALPARVETQVASWEAFLNGATLEERVVARYLYEHWFVAHLYFEDAPSGPFFELLRSRTPSGEPIEPIATRRPYDEPGEPFYYRLRPLDSTIVHKTHLVYPLSPARRERLAQLFLGGDWSATRFPSWEPAVASNPFVAFEEIPARSRYQFLLDDAHHFIDTFIRGPVCRGQVAVDVIEDHFWVAFIDPDRDLSVVEPGFLPRTKHLLALPSGRPGWLAYHLKQARYLDERERIYGELDPERRGPALDWIWDGDGRNAGALLTVFRNFDSATVVRGFQGEVPKTAWVIDYPIFERIYYNLVAGYDVFDALPHQVSTRLYMDHLRMQSENLFLAFLPPERREAIRASWYVGAKAQLGYFFANRPRGLEHGTRIAFTREDVKADLLEQIRRHAAAAGAPDPLNRCTAPPCERPGASELERAVEEALREIVSRKGPWVSRMPEVSVLRVRAGGQRDLAYTLLRHSAHTNVAFMFLEDLRRVPEDDTLSLFPGQVGSYPNFFFDVEAAQIEAFVAAVRGADTDAGFESLVARFGVRRSDPRFWSLSDWLYEERRRASPTEAGLHDLQRYIDP